MRTVEKIEEELGIALVELEEVEQMSESEVCVKYNSDSKAETLEVLAEEVESLEKELETAQPTSWANPVKEIFGSYYAMDCQFV